MRRRSARIALDVYMRGALVGTLTRASTGALTFSYSENWVSAGHSLAISNSLPVRTEKYEGQVVSTFFDNLLPDNEDIRRAIAARFATDGTEPFDLLSVIGRECVGALQILPQGEPPAPETEITGNPITKKGIGDILRGLGKAPLGIDRTKEFRISIAGVQEKTALLKQGGKWFWPKGATPTTHILKPAIGKLPNGINMTESVENEWACLQLAQHFGLKVAKAEMENFDGIRCLAVERFDRQYGNKGKSIARIPQEDLCQALGVPWAKKYERDGGPGIIKIMKLLDSSDERDRDRSDFFRAQMVFFLLGATDGHAKNFSTFRSETGFQLTPIYDVMSMSPALAARQVDPREAELAMKVGKDSIYRLDRIRKRHWLETAKACGFPVSEVEALIADLIQRCESLERVGDALKKRVSEKMVSDILWGVRKGLATFLSR